MDYNEINDNNAMNDDEMINQEVNNGASEIKENDIEAVEAESEAEEAATKTNWVKELREWVVAIAAAVIIAFLIREFIFTLVNVKGASMEPSLHENDRLYVNRLFYKPEKGDVVIFRPATDPKRPYVKRVIATEGDTIYINFLTGDVYVNDELIEEPYIKEKTHNVESYVSNLMKSGNYSKDNPIVIQPGYVWCMGDNRNNSLDSRQLGPIPVDEIIGGAVFRFWPLDSIGGVHKDAEEVSFMIDGDGLASLG